MDRPLLDEDYSTNALEYRHLFQDNDGMNYYSAKINKKDYLMVDDYGWVVYNIYSNVHIIYIDTDRFLYKHGSKYGVVSFEGCNIIPCKYDCIKKYDNYLLAGYGGIWKDEIYTGKYDLYNESGELIIGGFNDCVIKRSYFIFYFGYRWIRGKRYEQECIYKNIWLDTTNSFAIILDRMLKPYLKKELKFIVIEDVDRVESLCNNLPYDYELSKEYPPIDKGKRYIIDGIHHNPFPPEICASTAFPINNNIVYYSRDGETFGMVFCEERKIISPSYNDYSKGINEHLLLMSVGYCVSKDYTHIIPYSIKPDNYSSKVGIRNANKEILEPKYDFITTPYNGMALAFLLGQNGYECTLLDIEKDNVRQEYILTITPSELEELICDTKSWSSFSLSNKNKKLLPRYWKDIPHNGNAGCFFGFYMMEDENCSEDSEIKEDAKDWSEHGNWDYYNDNLDMDQQNKDFWNF